MGSSAKGQLFRWFQRNRRDDEVFFKFSDAIRAALRSDDRFLVSYPRSGNTWVRFVLAAACALRKGSELAEGPAGIALVNAVADQIIPDLHVVGEVPEPSHWNTLPHRIFKSHNIQELPSNHLVYLFRRPQDSLLSYAKFANRNPDAFASKQALVWAGEAEFAIKLANLHADQVMVISYERLQANPLATIRRISEHLAMSFSDEILRRALDINSFDRLQAFEKTSDGRKLAPGGVFFGSGHPGRGDSELGKEAIDTIQRIAFPIYEKLNQLEVV